MALQVSKPESPSIYTSKIMRSGTPDGRTLIASWPDSSSTISACKGFRYSEITVRCVRNRQQSLFVAWLSLSKALHF